MMTGEERTGWRDEWMSRHHRPKDKGGALTENEPMIDIDCIEFRNGEPVAIIDWKYRSTFTKDTLKHLSESWSVIAYYKIAIRMQLPAYILLYDRKGTYWLILNKYPRLSLLRQMNEREWQKWEDSF